MKALREGEDYIMLPDGRLVMTSVYLQRRGRCCGSGCLNCPYEYQAVAEPRRSLLLQERIRIQRVHGREE
ncbi:MAG: hypothetical protein JST06_11300 [Bacteroidetes bacterium]|nr:hypothetical protein [Bacteroidota bacterium]MBS1629589.1 hypothetical protein [Bacteroidota bacterium]